MTEKLDKLDCILLIDDDEATNFYHRVILEDEVDKTYIHAVKSARDGINYLLGKGDFEGNPQPGIIFLDINMPGLDGWDFLSEYNELSADIHDRSIVVLLTTSVNPDDRERAAQIPAVREFVSKPLTPEAFRKVVQENFN
ncbi:response regulator [Algoriphagus aestuariicola]|jgi:CheY-like chemotaxis protein|uniref:Response regulator n=1 Tax=Algoriphagus aestuariicola TaxID=1852016 RepID=A0ABS3BNK6_9BACT|nr:response regulator [Algoriphagus aestuariicola]MBN7800890.1 response regulator [Algoriphagus aestuariicola]